MSYLSRLDEARQQLVSGNFLAAERHYWAAHDEWDNSRLRAPMEKGVDPLLRLGGRVFGRDPKKPVLATFPKRQAQLLTDLRDVAMLLQRQAWEKAQLSGEQLSPEDVDVLGRALGLQKESRIYHLDAEQLWPITRGYLDGAQRLLRNLDVSALPEGLELSSQDAVWLVEWGRRRRRSQREDARTISAWLMQRLAAHLDRSGALGEDREALSLATRLALDDPAGAPLALDFGRRALAGQSPPEDAVRLLRVVTGLLCNEERLAVGSVDLALLHELGEVAARLGAAWPPAEIRELLTARGLREPSELVALAWSQNEARLLVLRLRHRAPVDVLLLPISDGSEGTLANFAVGLRPARQIVERSLREDACVLVAGSPPAWVHGIIGNKRMLRVDQLEAALGPATTAHAPMLPASAHPVFDLEDPLAAVWQPLLQEAQWLLPRLLTYTDRECFAPGWGLNNLRALAAVGVACADAFAHAVAASASASDSRLGSNLQSVPGPLALSWPPLAARPRRRGHWTDLLISDCAADQLLLHRPSSAELAAWAVACAPAQLYVDGVERAHEVAAMAAVSLDPTRVTVMPEGDICPENALRLLERWAEESLVQPQRGLDVLWLYSALSSAPEGELGPELAQGSEAARAELQQALAAAPALHCRLAPKGACFTQQLQERRRRSLVAIDKLERLDECEAVEQLLIDDPLPFCSQRNDTECLAFLAQLSQAWTHSAGAKLWFAAPQLGSAVGEGMAALFGSRIPRLRTEEAARTTRPVGFYCVPDGYRPQCGLLTEEAAALLTARLRRWSDRRGAKAVWTMGEVAALRQLPGLTALTGSAPTPNSPTVLLTHLCMDEFHIEIALLRLAAALSFAQAELVVLDPRVHELRPLLDKAEGLRPWRPERGLLAEGRSLLSELPPREVPHWRRPLHAERLRTTAQWLGWDLDPVRAEELARQLDDGADSPRLLLCELRDPERLLIAACLARLARESLDGGPAGIRTVVWLGEREGEARQAALALKLRHAVLSEAESSAREETLLEIEAGRVQWLQLSPAALAGEDLRRWAMRSGGLFWILPHLERWLVEHIAADPASRLLGARLRTLFAETKLRCIACLDEASDSPWAQVAAAEFALSPCAPSQRRPRFELVRRRLPDPDFLCAHCGERQPLRDSRQPCPTCGLARLDQPEQRVAAQVALAEATARYLRRGGPQEELLVIAAEEPEAEQLRRQLGVVGRAGDALFAAAPGAYAQQVLTIQNVFRAQPRPTRLVLSAMPRQAEPLRALLWRLHALGWSSVTAELLDHPVAWDLARQDDPEFGEFGPGAVLRQVSWLVTRPEVELRLRQLGSQGDALAGGSRLGLGPRAQWMLPAELDLATLWGELEALGLHFGAGAPALDRLHLDGFDAGQRMAIRWLVEENLLAVEPAAAASPPESSAIFFEGLLSLPYDVAAPLPETPRAEPAVARSVAEDTASADASTWLLGVAGSGKTTRLLWRAMNWPGRRRRLLLLPSAPALLPAAAACAGARPRLEIATVAELELAFLRQHHEADSFSWTPRLLPPALSEDGRRLRNELLREMSRRYALLAGAVPPVDIEDLQLVLEGRAPRALAKAEGGAAAALDLSLLAQCAEEARRDGGWITSKELRSWSKDALTQNPHIAEAWRRRYAAVLVDDVHSFAPEEMVFLDQLFPPEGRCSTADPNLLDPHRAVSKVSVEANSHRLPKDVARAAAHLLGSDPARRTAPRSLRRSRGGLERLRVLNLAACALRIESDAKAGLLDGGRNAVFVSHRGDLEPLATRLRESGLAIWPVDEVARLCADGPRQVLSALQLAHGLESDMPAEVMADLALVLLRAEGLWTAALDRHELARRLVSWRHGVGTQTQRPSESLLLVLLDVQRRLAGVWALAEAAQQLADAGLLARLLRSDAAAERIRRLLEQDGHRPWRSLPAQLPLSALAAPLAPGNHLWILRPEEASGLEFDRVYSICSGLEPVEHHYRALGRTREQFVLLFAERDPFAERP